MSLWDDYRADYAFERDYPFGVPGDIWTTKAGKKINLRDMATTHIRCCMKIVGEDDPWFRRFSEELDRRGWCGHGE